VDKCIDIHMQMSDTQLFNFCTDYKYNEKIKKMCFQYPNIYYNQCMMVDTDKDMTHMETCQAHWISNINRFS
jgi:hypothetical protein